MVAMKTRLRVKVEIPDPLHNNKFKELFRNQLELDESVSYDYQSLIKGIKLLFQRNDLIITLVLI